MVTLSSADVLRLTRTRGNNFVSSEPLMDLGEWSIDRMKRRAMDKAAASVNAPTGMQRALAKPSAGLRGGRKALAGKGGASIAVKAGVARAGAAVRAAAAGGAPASASKGGALRTVFSQARAGQAGPKWRTQIGRKLAGKTDVIRRKAPGAESPAGSGGAPSTSSSSGGGGGGGAYEPHVTGPGGAAIGAEMETEGDGDTGWTTGQKIAAGLGALAIAGGVVAAVAYAR